MTEIKEMSKGFALIFASEKYFCNFFYLTFVFRCHDSG